MGKNVLKM